MHVCNTLQHTATHRNTLHTLQHTAYVQPQLSIFFSPPVQVQGQCIRMSATYCNTLQHTATHCNILQHTATRRNILLMCSRNFQIPPVQAACMHQCRLGVCACSCTSAGCVYVPAPILFISVFGCLCISFSPGFYLFTQILRMYTCGFVYITHFACLVYITHTARLTHTACLVYILSCIHHTYCMQCIHHTYCLVYITHTACIVYTTRTVLYTYCLVYITHTACLVYITHTACSVYITHTVLYTLHILRALYALRILPCIHYTYCLVYITHTTCPTMEGDPLYPCLCVRAYFLSVCLCTFLHIEGCPRCLCLYVCAYSPTNISIFHSDFTSVHVWSCIYYTYCNKLQHIATHCNTLQHSATLLPSVCICMSVQICCRNALSEIYVLFIRVARIIYICICKYYTYIYIYNI